MKFMQRLDEALDAIAPYRPGQTLQVISKRGTDAMLSHYNSKTILMPPQRIKLGEGMKYRVSKYEYASEDYGKYYHYIWLDYYEPMPIMAKGRLTGKMASILWRADSSEVDPEEIFTPF